MGVDKLIIVESPHKADTISDFVKDAIVIASKGHIMDLPGYKTGIKIEGKTFIPEYVVTKDHEYVVRRIIEEAKDRHVYLATDEDREGEAIAWTIANALKKDPMSFDRITFHEITKSAILHALEHPRKLDMNSVRAQQARRMLDRLVGFKLSPLLSKKLRSGLSAGRVQSAALKLVLDKERAIREFKPVTYYEITTLFKTDVEATLVEHKGSKIEKLSIVDKQQASSILDSVSKDVYEVVDISSKTKHQKAPAPFMTSTLQQAAHTAYGFTPDRTMSIAQRLYEGVHTPQGKQGLITYMRTDSLNLAQEALDAIRGYIQDSYKPEYLPDQPLYYKSKAKGAQEAHEAIRPSNITLTPDVLKTYLDDEQYKLYKLIWTRTVMCQMSDAILENMTAIVKGNENTFKVVGSKVQFDGWTILRDNTKEDKLIPSNWNIGTVVELQSSKDTEKQTEPPSRYNSASLVKTLEEAGIGRPSTYASIMKLLINRGYVNLINNKGMSISDTGERIVTFLEKYFPNIVDAKFTSDMENQLDEIAEGKLDRDEVLASYILPMIDKITGYMDTIPSEKTATLLDENCPKCGKQLVERTSKSGEKFIGCTGYPKCKYIKVSIPEDTKDKCILCNSPVIARTSKKGKPYWKCSNSDCKFITFEPLIDHKCNKCGTQLVGIVEGDVVKRSRCLKCEPYEFKKKFKPKKKK